MRSGEFKIAEVQSRDGCLDVRRHAVGNVHFWSGPLDGAQRLANSTSTAFEFDISSKRILSHFTLDQLKILS